MGSWAGLYFTTSSDGYQIFGYGLYKVKNSESDSYFYIDYRDQRVGCSPYGNNGHFIDVWFKYNATLDKFYYSNNSSDFFQISNGQLLRIWELKNAGTPQTSSLPNYWTKCLVLVPSINNNPHLVWGPYPNSTPSGYRIYRSISQISHPTQPFQIIGTTLSNTFDFIDYEIRLNQTGSYVFYYITAIINGSNSSASNTVMARGDLYKENSKNENVLAENQLYENYPNPFNPSTKISWQSPVSSWQVLKVFDVLGNEIATLVDEYREAGRYESEFDASNLSSGIYYYKLQSGSFVGTKKMVLLR